MTTDDYLAYYANLLPSQFLSQPNAVATIELLASLALMPQGGNVVTDSQGNPVFDSGGHVVVDGPYGELMSLALADAFVLDNAVGQQLQFLGKLVGAKNSGYDLSGNFVTLSDADYRNLIKAVAGRNQLRATNGKLDVFFSQYFNGIMTYTDQLGMAMTFNYLVELGTVPWAELFITEGYLPRALCVQANINYTYPVAGPFFSLIGEDEATQAPNTIGLDSETGNLTGYVLAESQNIPYPY